MSTEPVRAVEVFLRYLRAEKVDTVFGVVGGLAYPLFRALDEDPRFRFVMAKHEQGAAFMADGYSRVGRRLGVCVGTGGPGSTNLLTGVACAFADGVPLLVITGQAATHSLGRGAAQETAREDIDIVAMFRPISKYSAMVTDANSLAHHVRRALRLALSGRPGPVHLNVPVDIWEKPVVEAWFSPDTYRSQAQSFDRSSVQRAGDLLLDATHPIFLAGSGVSVANSEQILRELAQLIDARVATTPRAKGVFPEDDFRSLGVLGTAGHEAAKGLVLGDHVDVLFAIGASLNETTTFNWTARLQPSNALIQLDIDEDRIARSYPVDVALVGDAQAVLVELVYHLHRRIREGARPKSNWRQWSTIPPLAKRYVDQAARESLQLPLRPERWRAELTLELPDNAVIFSDIGGHMLFNIHHLCIRREQRFIINLGFGSMGHGTVAPIGAALSGIEAPIIAIIGDACFTMNGMDLLTSVQHQARVLWLVENNNMHGITWHASKALSGGTGLESAKSPVDVAAIARAMGVPSLIVDSPGQIVDAVRRGLAHDGPFLIEIRVDPEAPPPIGERTKSLAGFIGNQ